MIDYPPAEIEVPHGDDFLDNVKGERPRLSEDNLAKLCKYVHRLRENISRIENRIHELEDRISDIHSVDVEISEYKDEVRKIANVISALRVEATEQIEIFHDG